MDKDTAPKICPQLLTFSLLSMSSHLLWVVVDHISISTGNENATLVILGLSSNWCDPSISIVKRTSHVQFANFDGSESHTFELPTTGMRNTQEARVQTSSSVTQSVVFKFYMKFQWYLASSSKNTISGVRWPKVWT